MPEASSNLESRLNQLSRRLGAVERRLAELEAERATTGHTVAPPAEEDLPVSEAGRWFSAEALPRYGRTLVVFGGAFLLRAITEGGLIPQIAGTVLGIVYAMFWFLMVDRAAARGRLRSATFHGLAAAGIAFPLVWEATVKFRFLPPTASAGVLAAITALGLVVVTRRRLTGLAWVVALGAAMTALALAVPMKMWSLFVFELLLLGLVMLWLGYERRWQALAWTVSALVTVTILLMTAIVLLADEERTWELFSPDMLLAIQLSWVVIFFGTIGYRKLSAGEDLTPGEISLGFATLVAGFGGGTAVTRSTWVSGTSLGVVSLLLAAGLYGVAFVFADRKGGQRQGFILYSTFALLVTLVASGASLRGNALAVTFSLAALLTAWLGARRARATLSLHSAVYIIAAALTTDLLSNVLDVYTAASLPTGWITPYVLTVLAVSGVFFGLPVATHGRTWGRFSRVPMLAVIAVLVFGAGALTVTLAGRLVPQAESTADPGVLAALRTGVLAVVAVLLAWLSRKPRWPEAFWLLYPTLALGGIKLLLDDVRRGRPATLFFSFVLYGAALIVAPRLAKRRG